MTFRVVRTARLVLRDLTEADVADLVEYRNDAETARLQDWPLPYPDERARALVARVGQTWPISEGWYQIAVEFDGRLAGDIGVGRADEGRQAEIGYTLAPWARGQGLATEAVAAVLDLLFSDGVHRVFAGVDPENLPSANLLRRLGFRHEGHFVSAYLVRGVWCDDDRYAILADEWAALRDGS